MDRIDLTGSLAVGTIGIVLIVLVVLLLPFLRKPGNRHRLPDNKTVNVAERLDKASAGASPSGCDIKYRGPTPANIAPPQGRHAARARWLPLG